MKLLCLFIFFLSSTSLLSTEGIKQPDKSPKQQFKKIQNRWKSNQYIHIQRGTPQSSTIQSTWSSAQWSFENVQGGFVRIKNRWKGTYLHNQYGRLTAGKIDRGWWSAQWKLERVGNFFRIKNRWKNTYLHIERGSLQLSSIDKNWHSAQWSLVNTASTSPRQTTRAAQQPTMQTVAFPSKFNGYWYKGSTPIYYVNNSRTIRVSNTIHYVQQSYYENGVYKILTETAGRFVMFHVNLSNPNTAYIYKSNVYANRDAAKRSSRGNYSSYARKATSSNNSYSSNSGSSNSSYWPTAYFPSQLNGAWKFSNGTKATKITNSSKIEYQGYNYTVVKTMLKSGIHKIIARYSNNYYYAFYFKVLTQNKAQFWRSSSYQSVAQAEQARMGTLSVMYKSVEATWRSVGFPAILNGNWYASSTNSWMYEFKNSRTIRAKYSTYNIQNTMLKGNTYKILVRNSKTGFYHAFYVVKTANSSSIRMSLTKAANYPNQVSSSLGQLAYYTKKVIQKKNSNVATKTVKTIGKGIYNAGKATGNVAKSGAKAVGNYFTGGKKKAGSKYITFQNTAGYVAKFSVKYISNGRELQWNSGDMALGAKKNFKIPVNAKNIRVNGRAKKAFGGYKSIFKWKGQSFQNKCYKAYGTIFSPKYNNNCK